MRFFSREPLLVCAVLALSSLCVPALESDRGSSSLPDKPHTGSPQRVEDPSATSTWQLVSSGYASLGGLAVNARGDLFFNDIPAGKTFVIPAKASAHENEPEKFLEESGHAKGQAFGPDGRLYAAAAGERKVVAYTGADSMDVITDDFAGEDVAVHKNGNLYVTQNTGEGPEAGKIWLLRTGKNPYPADTRLGFCGGLALGSDQTRLYVADTGTQSVYRYVIQRDGSLGERGAFFRLRWPSETPRNRSCGLHVTASGHVLVAGPSGIHVCDEMGREIALLPTPHRQTTHVAVAGPALEDLYAACGDALYTRKIRIRDLKPMGSPSNPDKHRNP